jgi:cob(I)alamin adenosyltransferase
MSKDTSLYTEVLYCSQPISKNNYIIELYGLIDEFSSALSFVLNEVNENKEIFILLEKTNQFLSKKVIPDISYIYFNPHIEYKTHMEDWSKLENEFFEFIQSVESVDFISNWNNNAALWLNESRVRARKIERYMVFIAQNHPYSMSDALDVESIDYHQNSQEWEGIIDFFNELSSFLYKLGVLLND